MPKFPQPGEMEKGLWPDYVPLRSAFSLSLSLLLCLSGEHMSPLANIKEKGETKKKKKNLF